MTDSLQHQETEFDEAFADISEKKKPEKPQSSVKKLDLTQRKFADDSYNNAVDFAEDWLKLTSYVLGILNSVDLVNKKLREFDLEFTEIDKASFAKDINLLYELKTFQHTVDALNFTKSQKALIIENYINSKMRPSTERKSLDLQKLQEVFEQLSGKK